MDILDIHSSTSCHSKVVVGGCARSGLRVSACVSRGVLCMRYDCVVIACMCGRTCVYACVLRYSI